MLTFSKYSISITELYKFLEVVGWLTFFLSVYNTWNGGHLKNNNILIIRMVQENKCIDMEDTKCTTVYEEQCKSGTEKKCSTVYDTVTKRFFRA